MADETIAALIPIEDGDDAKAKPLRQNFKYLDDRITAQATNISNKESISHKGAANGYCPLDTNAKIPDTYLSNFSSSIDGRLNEFEETINGSISAIQSTVNSIGYTQKSATVGIGTTQMTSYLPQDGKQYLVWFEAGRGAKNSDSLFVASNKQTVNRKVYQLDGDSGRSSYATAYGIVPTTSTGWIRFEGSTDYVILLGYCRI